MLIALSFRAVIGVIIAFLGRTQSFYLLARPVAITLSLVVLALFADTPDYARLAAVVERVLFNALP